jgi:type I restriction enzyme M protein
MAKIMQPEEGMEIYDPTCGSAGLLIKCEIELDEKMKAAGKKKYSPLKLYGQEFIGNTWAMAKMNMVIHDMEGEIEIGDTMKNPKFRNGSRLRKFDRVVANPMWNQPGYGEDVYTNDELDRFPTGAGFPGNKADWGWMQHILASLDDNGKAAVVVDTGASSRGSGNANTNKEKDIRKWFVDNDLIEGVVYLPENLFYNTPAPGIVIFFNLNKSRKQKGKLFLINASKEFVKGDPKNYIPDESIEKIAKTFNKWKEIEKFSKIVDKDEVVKNDYNMSPSRYIHVSDEEEYRPIGEIVEDLFRLEEDAKGMDKELKKVLKKVGF